MRKQLLENTKGRDSVLGTYDIDENGDTTLTDYGLYTIKNGKLDLQQGDQGPGGLSHSQRIGYLHAAAGAGSGPPPPRVAPCGRTLESASVPADAPRAEGPRRSVRDFLSRYGLIALLLALPVYYGIQDLSEDGNLTRLGNNLMDGLSNGAIWALVALGYTLVYGIIELINFAHGEIFMLGAFTSFALYGTLGLTTSTGTAGLVAGLLVTLMVAMSSARRST